MRSRLASGFAGVLATMLATGCNGEVEGTPSSDGATVSTNAPPSAQPATVEEMLAQPPPPIGAAGRIIESIAKHFQVGTYRCPIPGNGRVHQMYGTERDRLAGMGPMWALEIDAATDPTWDHIFDDVMAEEHWVTGLAMPGATRSYVGRHGRETYAFDHPPAVAGSTVVCTAVHEYAPRSIKGIVNELQFKDSTLRNAVFSDCSDLNATAVFIPKEGKFEATTSVPCVVWVEQPGHRSEKIKIEPGDEPLEVTFTIAGDPLQIPEGGWSPDGRKTADASLERTKERFAVTKTYIEELKTEFANDPDALNVLARLGADHAVFGRLIEGAFATLNTPTPEKAKKKATGTQVPKAPPKTNP